LSGGEQRPGAGGEILQARADRQHDIGLFREAIGGADVPVTPTAPC
jgi:hypothetical protein